jgi:hypothetical protein
LAKEVPKSEHGMKQVQAAAHCVTEAAERPAAGHPDRYDAGDQPAQAGQTRPEPQKSKLTKTKAQEGPMTVWITCWVPPGLSVGLSPASDVR